MDRILKVRVTTPASIREKVYHAIRNDILNGRISPGTRIVESRLAKEIKTSRTPVREALHTLEREGLLEAIPRVGYKVKELKWDEVEEICEIRLVNEILAAKWAMKKATPEVFQALEKNISVSFAEVEAGNVESFVELDAEFHEIIARASGSSRLAELCQLLRRHMLRYRMESLHLPETALRAIEGHKRILDCMNRKDEEGVTGAIKDHLDYAKRSIRRYAFRKEQPAPVCLKT